MVEIAWTWTASTPAEDTAPPPTQRRTLHTCSFGQTLGHTLGQTLGQRREKRGSVWSLAGGRRVGGAHGHCLYKCTIIRSDYPHQPAQPTSPIIHKQEKVIVGKIDDIECGQ